jgi:hypothetical protein
MSEINLEPLDEDIYPREVRKRVNELTDILCGPMEVKVGEDLSPKGRVERSKDKTVIVVPRSRSGGSENKGGFSIITRKIQSVWKAGIIFRSYLFENYDAAPSTITGLLTEDRPSDTDAGWFAVSAGIQPFLKTTLNVDATSGVISLNAATIEHTGYQAAFQNDGGHTVGSDTIYNIVSANIKIGIIITNPQSQALEGRNYFNGARLMQGIRVISYHGTTDPQNLAALYPGPF